MRNNTFPKTTNGSERIRTERAAQEYEIPAIPRSAGISFVTRYPQGDSNPCRRRERAVSWASRRWGPIEGAQAGRQIGAAVAHKPTLSP